MPFPPYPLRPGPLRFLSGTPPYGVGTTPQIYGVSPATDRLTGGTNVTITGLNFIGSGITPTVKFGTLTATNVVVVSDTVLTCDTPAATVAGVVDVTVTIGPLTGTLIQGFTYYETRILSVTPPAARLNGGQRVTINGLNFIAGMTVKFDGVNGVNTVFVDDRTYSTEVPSHAVGFVDVTIWVGATLYATLRNGFQYTSLVRGEDIRRQPGITIRDALNNAPNSCSFRVDGASKMPEPGEKIEILDRQDGNRKLFAGTIQKVEQVYEELTNQLAWNVTCVDFTWLMNKRRPFGSWRHVSASQVVQDLIRRFAPGFTTNFVQTNLAKVSVTLDGSKDMSTVLTELAQAIGGGHWYVDYDQDVHFFHIVPPGLVLPPSQQAPLGANLTVAEGGLIPAAFSYDEGFYFFRHTFVYSDGTETRFGSISNVIRLSGTRNLSITGIPLGVDQPPLTVVARRIYYTQIVRSKVRKSSLETITGLWQVNDNVTTSFNTTFEGGLYSTDSAAVSQITPIKSYTAAPGSFSPASPVAAGYVLLSDQAADLALTGSVSMGGYAGTDGSFATRGWGAYSAAGNLYGNASQPNPRLAGDVYYASPDVATEIEAQTDSKITKLPQVSFAGHLPGPTNDGVLTPTIEFNVGYFYALWSQMKVAYIYRDGSVSYPGPGSNLAGMKNAIKGQAVRNWSFTNLPIGPSVNGVDVVARVIYLAYGRSSDPNYSQTGIIQVGYVWPVPMLDPDWSDSGGMAYIVPNNTQTDVTAAEFQFTGYGSDRPYHTGVSLGNPDPIPVWPNPDGPFLENTDPPDPLDSANTTLLREPAITSDVDISQVRNRIYVIGAGSTSTITANAGATSILVADITSFSPNGGKVRIEDAATGKQTIIDYIGLSGQVGATALELAQSLPVPVTQGSNVSNFFQADDIESQKALAKLELDKNGRQTDGIHEYTIVDQSLRAVFQLYMRAHAELELWSRPIVSVSYATRDPKTRSGKTVHVDLTNPPISGDFLIQDVTIDQIHDESDQLMPRYTVRASSIRFDLDDLLLQLLGRQVGSTQAAGLVATSVTTSTEFVSDSAILVRQLTLTDAQMRAGGTYTLVPGELGVAIAPIGGYWHAEIITSGPSNVNGTVRHQASGGSPVTIFSGTFWTTGGGVPVLRFGVGTVSAYNQQSLVDFRGLGVEVNIGAGAGGSFATRYGFVIIFSYMVYTYPVVSS